MAKRKTKHKWHHKINPFKHLELTIRRMDQDNDRFERRVYRLNELSLVIAVLGVALAIYAIFFRD